MAVNLVLLLGFSFIALSVGAPNCAKPCEDLWAAKNCNKVQYCIENDWSKIKPTGKTDNVCDICLRMVQEARTTLESKDMQDTLKQVFEGSCRLLVLKPAVELCDKLADQFVPELVAVLSSQMDPETVCTVAKLCNNDMLRALQKNSGGCTGCQKFMATSKEKMKSVSEEEFKEELVHLCRNTGSFSDACYNTGRKYSSLLYNHTQMALNGKPCEATLLCPSGSTAEFAEKEQPDAATQGMCSMCPRVIEDIIDQLMRIKSFDDYHKNFYKMCTKLSFPSDFCSQSAKSTRIYNFLKENAKSLSRSFCSKTICAEKRSKEVPVWPLLPALHFPPSVEEIEDVILGTLVYFIGEDGGQESSVDGEPEKSQRKLPSPVDCKTCKLTLKKVSQVFPGDARKDVMNGSVDKLCSRLPKEAKEKCLSMAQTNSKEIKEVVLQHSTPEEACSKMSFCFKPEAHSPVAAISVGDPLENPIFFAPAAVSPLYESDCKLCRELSQALSYYVNTYNTHRSNVLQCLVVKNMSECFDSLKSYSPDISQAFVEYVSFEKVCEDIIPSCESKKGYMAPKRESMDQCETCQTWVDSVTKLFVGQDNLEMMTATLKLVCDKLAEGSREKCQEDITQRSTEMLANILKLLSPDETCKNLNYCPRREIESEEASAPVSSTSLEETSELEKVPCKFCLLAVKTLMDQLENEKTEASIRKAIKTLCNYFPEETRDTCRNLIDQYAEDLIDMIMADFSPSEICIRLKLCKPNNTISYGSPDERPVQTFDIGTNEVRDEEPEPLKKTSVMKEFEAEQARLLQQVHSAVEECALCEALVQVISSHKKMLVKDYDFAGNSSVICRIVPRHKRKQCMSMVVSYGPSIVNLIVDKKVDPNNVCLELTLCDSNMHAKVDMPVSLPEPPSSSEECLKGPSYWCASEENARKCGTYLHCREVVWKREKRI